jgi:hypothetical protein
MKVLQIRTNGDIEEIEIDKGLESLQKSVGGMIEYLQVTDEVHAFIDEEGKLKGKKVNALATMVCCHFDVGLMPGDLIVGDMVLLGSLNEDGEADGDSYDIPDNWESGLLPRQLHPV